MIICAGLGIGLCSWGQSSLAWVMDQEGALNLEAQQAIECVQEGQYIKATGGVRVQKGRAVIRGDTLVGRCLRPFKTPWSKEPKTGISPQAGSSKSPSPLSLWKDMTVTGHVRIEHPNGTIVCDQATYDAVNNQWHARGRRIDIMHADWHVVCHNGVVQCSMVKRILCAQGDITWTHRHTRQQVKSRHVELIFAPGPLLKRSQPNRAAVALGLGPVQRIQCTQSVTFWSPQFHGKAGRADYDLAAKIIDLDQGVVVVFGPQVVHSRKARWNLESKQLHVPPSANAVEPVSALITPVSGSKDRESKNQVKQPLSALGRRQS